MSISRIFISCTSDPIDRGSFSVAETYEYSPLVIEASMLGSEENIVKSTNKIERNLGISSLESEIKVKLEQLFDRRKYFLQELRSVPEVQSFLGVTTEHAEELLKSLQEEETILKELKVDKKELQHRLLEIIAEHRREGERVGEFEFLIDAIHEAVIGKGNKLKGELEDYVKKFNDTLSCLVDKREDPKLIYTILGADVEYVADKKESIKTGKSLAIPLDLSPLRLALGLIKDKKIYEQSKKSYPPLFLLFNPDVEALNLARPYRTLDGHPVFIRAPKFEADKNTAQREINDARENFEKNVGPLLLKIKGLAGTREVAPSLIKKNLVKIVQSYISFNPLSREKLRVTDLGCGTGELLRKIFVQLLEEEPIGETIHAYILLNDDCQPDVGNRFRSISYEEGFSGVFYFRIWKGDLRELIGKLVDARECYDIAFINRVLDMYGGWGVFEFEFKPRRSDQSSSSFYSALQAIDPNVGRVLAFTESTCHEGAWRAIKYIFDRQAHKRGEGTWFVPAIDMKMRKNFFEYKGRDLFQKLLDISKLIVISVFPGNFETLFPEIELEKGNIFARQKSSPMTYSIICASRNKELVELIERNVLKID